MRHSSWLFGVVGGLVLHSSAWAAGNANEGKEKAEMCAGCHGEVGVSAAPIFPNLAGQHAGYLTKQLYDFRSKARVDQTMNDIAEGLSDDDVEDLAAYFSAQPVKKSSASPNDDEVGKRLYQGGSVSQGVPACAACHGVDGQGLEASGFPMLKGQHTTYLVKTLSDYKAGLRANDKNGMMRGIASKLSEAEIKSVTDFISGLQ